MNLLFLGILTVLPGAWITFGLPFEEFSRRVRLALGVALSPAVVAIQFLVARFIGMDFASATLVVLFVDVPCALLLMRSLLKARHIQVSRTLVLGSSVFLILAASLMLPWLLIPQYRVFSWHSLLHTDVIYALTRNRLLPEEPELAGLTLAYDWFGEIYWSVLGWLSNWSPTAIYPVTNLIWLLVAFVLAYELCKEGLGLHTATALFGVGIMFLGSQIIGVSAWLLANDTHRWQWILGTVNNTALLNEYQGFEDLPFAFAVLLGLALVCLVSLRRRIRLLPLLVASLVISTGLIYPILFPMACLLSGGTIFLLASRWPKDLPYYKPSELLLLAGGLAIAIVVSLAFLRLTTTDRTIPALQLLQGGRWSRSLQMLTTLLPFILLAAPFIVKSFLNRFGPAMLLTMTGLSLAALYTSTRMSQTISGAAEDKLFFGCAIALAPLSAAGVDRLFRRFARTRWALVLVVPLILAILNALFMFRLGAGIPSNLAAAPRVNENSFWIALAPDEEDMSWTRVIRESTPIDTIVVALKPGIHLQSFLARSLYFPSDYDGRSIVEYRVSPAGYSVDKRFFFLQQRGYSESIWNERLGVVETLYRETDSTRLEAVLQSLQDLKRPLAIHFSNRASPALAWLKNRQIGAELFSDSANVVWFIMRPSALPNRTSGAISSAVNH